MKKVSKRGGFSDRNGIKPENITIQLKDFDKRTRIQLQNMISNLYCIVYEGDLHYSNQHIQKFIKFVLGSIYSEAIDTRKIYDDDPIMDMISETILNSDYDDVLTLIEALVQYWDVFMENTKGGRYSGIIFEMVNECFKREYVGYRFLDRIIVPISDVQEIESIKEAVNNKYQSVSDHIKKANKLLADRNHPDYENSIKESISAVEAISEIITGTRGKEATLGNMLKKLENSGIVVHKGLKSAFNILYGYTCDANGIRHAGDIGGAASTFEEAKFMLVACCAFINYLTALSAVGNDIKT